MTPRVSICIPAYGQPELLERALASVAEQTFGDHEVIVTDDSPDTAVEQVAEKFRTRLQLHYHRNATRLGSPENWNEAVRRSRGSLIKILHHDDWFHDARSLGQFVRLMDENPAAPLGFAFTQVHDAAARPTRVHAPAPEEIERIRRDPRELFFGNRLGPPSATIVRRERFRPFDRKLKWLVDVDHYIQVLLPGGALACHDRALIRSTAGAAHQVTAECVENPEIEVYELLYLYHRLDTRLFPATRRVRFVGAQFRRFGLETTEQVRRYARDLKIPTSVRLYSWLHSLWRRTSRESAATGRHGHAAR